MRVVVEELVQQKDAYGVAKAVGWKTDGIFSRYWAGRRWQELNENGRVCRLVTARGDLVQL